MSSYREAQLKLDFIDEEEKIDEMFKDTHNFWSQDMARNEDNYER